MQIHSFTRFLAFPFIVAAGYVMYQNAIDYYFSEAHSWILLPLIVILVGLYILSPQIDFWWLQKFPIKIDSRIKSWLQERSSFYQGLSETERVKFEKRLSLFMRAKEFALMSPEKMEMPEDMKAIIATNAVQMSFHQDNFLLSGYDRIVAYPHPFPTPYYKHLHSVETEEVDGVILLCIDYVVHGMTVVDEYNIALHAFAEAYLEKSKREDEVHVSDTDAALLPEISGIPMDKILKTIGFDHVDLVLVAIHHYLKYPNQFLTKLPVLCGQIKALLADRKN